jgi:DNA-binding beta-propeller fold protein YncE
MKKIKNKSAVLFILLLFVGCASMPAKKAVPGSPVFYPPPPQQPRLQFLCSISGEQDFGKKQSAFREFIIGKPRYKTLGKPYDVGASKGKIYLLDRMYRRVVVLDLEEKILSFLNDHGAGALINPSGIWISEEDIKYVADMQRKQVVVFDENDNFLRTYGSGEVFEKPVDVAVFGNRIYVVDIAKNQVVIMDRDTGESLKIVGVEGDFFKPSHVTVDASGNIFVTDAFNFRVKKIMPDGTLAEIIGFHGDQVGGFARPKGLAVDREENLYTVDAAFENVQIFNEQGKPLLFFGGAGAGPGKMYLPAGIAIDYDNVGYFSKFADPSFKVAYLVYVTNTYGGHKLNVYGFGEWVGETMPE